MQETPELDYVGWKRMSATPDLNFLSQIVVLLYEDESKPVDSSNRYYIHIHIGSGVKARKQTFSEGVPFIDGETHLPSFVKRLPTMPVNRGSESSLHLPQASTEFRKISSYPFLYSTEVAPVHVHTPPPQRRASHTVTSVPSSDGSQSSPDSPGRKLTLGYTDESLLTLGEPGELV